MLAYSIGVQCWGIVLSYSAGAQDLSIWYWVQYWSTALEHSPGYDTGCGTGYSAGCSQRTRVMRVCNVLSVSNEANQGRRGVAMACLTWEQMWWWQWRVFGDDGGFMRQGTRFR